MADFSRLLISKILSERDITPALEAGIRANWFEDEEHERAYRWMTEYFTKYGKSPTPRAFRNQFPVYRLINVVEPYEYYVDHFQTQRRRMILVDSLIDADDALKQDDLAETQAVISRGLMRVNQEVSSLTDEDALGKFDSRMAEYRERRKRVGKIVGVPTGFPTLDLVSGGWQPQQFILFGGRAKQAKSFMLMRSALAAQDANRKVLFMTFEMSVQEQLARYEAIVSGINSLHIIQGNMSDEEFVRMKKGMRQRRGLPPFIISADISASTTLSGLAAKIEQHQPDIVFVDGIYLMDSETKSDPSSPQAMTAISRGLKRLAQRIKKPLVCTTQALESKMNKSREVTLFSLGWTSAFSQDADLILGVERIDETLLATLRVVAGRNVSPRKIDVLCDFETSNFDEANVDEDEDEEE